MAGDDLEQQTRKECARQNYDESSLFVFLLLFIFFNNCEHFFFGFNHIYYY